MSLVDTIQRDNHEVTRSAGQQHKARGLRPVNESKQNLPVSAQHHSHHGLEERGVTSGGDSSRESAERSGEPGPKRIGTIARAEPSPPRPSVATEPLRAPPASPSAPAHNRRRPPPARPQPCPCRRCPQPGPSGGPAASRC